MRRKLLRKNGLRVQCTQTIMRSAEDKAALAREALASVSPETRKSESVAGTPLSAPGPPTVILVPIKNTASAKQRLASVLDQPSRTKLAQAMLHDVLEHAYTPGRIGRPLGS